MIGKELKKLIISAMAFATISGKNPHVIGIAYAKVVGKNKIIITDNFMKETPKNLKRNNNVALAVWNKNWERKTIGYELRGTQNIFLLESGRNLLKI